MRKVLSFTIAFFCLMTLSAHDAVINGVLVDSQDTTELMEATVRLLTQGVAHRYIQYQTGGHGFGVSARKGTEECRAWKEEFLKWLRQL